MLGKASKPTPNHHAATYRHSPTSAGQRRRYQYVVVNDNLERAYTQVTSIVDAETVRHERLPLLDERLAELIDALDRQIHEYSSIRI